MNETDSKDVLKYYSGERILITSRAGCIGSNILSFPPRVKLKMGCCRMRLNRKYLMKIK